MQTRCLEEPVPRDRWPRPSTLARAASGPFVPSTQSTVTSPAPPGLLCGASHTRPLTSIFPHCLS